MLLVLFTCHAQNKWKDHHQHRALNLKFFLNALQDDYFNIITWMNNASKYFALKVQKVNTIGRLGLTNAIDLSVGGVLGAILV